MFRQTGNSAPAPSKHGQLLTTDDGGGAGTNVTIVSPIGQQPMATSVSVAIASDQSAVPISVANGADVAEGSTTDAAVDTDTTGTVSGKLRGLVKLWVNYLTRFPASLGQTTMAGSLPVAIASNQSAVTVVQTTSASLNAQVIGLIAHATANTSSNKPAVGGFEAIAFGANPTAVAAGDVTKPYANRAGIPFTLGGHPNVITLEAAYTSAQTNAAIVTISTGLKIVVTQIQAITAAATSVDVDFRIGFATATTPTTTGVVLTHPGIKASSGSGVSRGDGSAVIGVGADNEDLRITSSVPTGGSLRVLVSYFTVES